MPPSRFTVLVALSVYRVLATMRKRDRDRILRFLDQLEDDPYGLSHYREIGDAEQSRDVTIIGSHAITYWIDYADKHVKILRIEPAGS